MSEDVYKQPVTVSGLTRDSTGYATLVGMTFAVSDAFYGDISLGWGEQNSIAADTAPIEGFLFNADIVWMPTPMTLVEFLANSQIATANTVDSLGAVSRSYRLSLQHAFWRYLVVGGYLSYETADYTDNPLVDERLREGLTMEYFFNPNMSVYTRYEHTDFFSTDPFGEYTENEIRVGLSIRN
nr:outer membrane beta-barrel protein [Methyloceanibacter caenitepidi]